MTIGSQEHQDVMSQFERESKGFRLDKEPRGIWPLGRIYQDGHVNEVFLSYRRGYALAKSIYQIASVQPNGTSGGALTGEGSSTT